MINNSLLLFTVVLICCSNPKSNNHLSTVHNSSNSEIEIDTTPSNNGYDFSSPSENFVLDRSLNEISGLSYDSENHSFITIDDESGNFYKLDGTNLITTKRTKFYKKGDYEAIEKVGHKIYVCRSSGNIYVYDTLTKNTEVLKNNLNSSNDIEGLCYESQSNTLLIACKGQPLNKLTGSKNQKCVYQFDLSKNELDPNPYLSITDEALITFVNNQQTKLSKSKQNKRLNKVKNFSPSGIAIHPSTNDFYIISAKESIVIILDKNKNLKNIQFLNSKLIPQPEGIAFGKNQDLYIATEGKGFSGKIFKFTYSAK